MPGRRASRSHLHLVVMPQRCSVKRGIGIGDQDGCQARAFCNLMTLLKLPLYFSLMIGCCGGRDEVALQKSAFHVHFVFALPTGMEREHTCEWMGL